VERCSCPKRPAIFRRVSRGSCVSATVQPAKARKTRGRIAPRERKSAERNVFCMCRHAMHEPHMNWRCWTDLRRYRRFLPMAPQSPAHRKQLG